MRLENYLTPISEQGHRVLDLMKVDHKHASELLESLPRAEQVNLVSNEALNNPLNAQELVFLLDDDEGKKLVDELGDRTLFRLMKSQCSTHIGVLSLVEPDRIQSILDLDSELFSTKGVTDPQTAYHWLVSFLEEDEETFSKVLKSLDIKLVASAFQDKMVRPGTNVSSMVSEEDSESTFTADFLIKLDRGELKPDDLELTDEETLDILKKIHLLDENYFVELVSLMMREEDLKTRTAEEALSRINDQVGDMKDAVQEAEDMFVPLDD
ncbi:MAG: hypothetical protein P4L38_08715 [Syntrophaceae bacterium]|nr:hypothetical protein [Syntrophaceae bacterium]